MRVLKALLIFFSFSSNIFAAPIGSTDEAHSEQKKCELLVTAEVKKSADPELNHQLHTQIRAETFVNTIEAKGEGLGFKTLSTFNLQDFIQGNEKLQKMLAQVLNKSIEGFDRHSYQSKGYVEKGLQEEDGVIYEVFHPDNTSSYIILSRGGDSLDGFDLDVFANGDLKVGRAQGQMYDLSGISIEVWTELEFGMLKGERFVTTPYKNADVHTFNFVTKKEQWLKYLGDRLNQAHGRGMIKREEVSHGNVYVKEDAGDKSAAQ